MNTHQIWEEHNSKINGIIGKLTVEAMKAEKDSPLRKVHQELIDFANWFDEIMEENS